MKLIVVGAGIGGLSAAVALARAGCEVELLEQAPRFAEVGAGLQLSPNAMRVLRRWGLAAAAAAAGFAPEAAEVRDAASGALMLRTPLGADAERRWGAPYLQIHRADLQAILARAVAAEPAVVVRLGVEVSSVEQDAAVVRVKLLTGETVVGDALVGADGLRSIVRQALLGPTPARFTGQVAWRATVETERLPADLRPPPVAAVWAARGRHLVHYYVRGGALVNLVGVVERDWREESWTARGDPADLARDFDRFPHAVRGLLAHLEEAWRWALYDRPPLRRWSTGRATLLGDAAHPMLPFLAQGAAMAIEDAEALARRLAVPGEVEAALQDYAAERAPRTARVQAWSRRNALLFHLPAPIGRVAFGAAGLLDRLEPSAGARRFDWVYGYRPPASA